MLVMLVIDTTLVPLLPVVAAILAVRVRSRGRTVVMVLELAVGAAVDVVVVAAGWRCWRRGRRRRGRWVALGARGAGDDFFHLLTKLGLDFAHEREDCLEDLLLRQLPCQVRLMHVVGVDHHVLRVEGARLAQENVLELLETSGGERNKETGDQL